jgi:glycosyltransferase involved in cell wall biosynthesis
VITIYVAEHHRFGGSQQAMLATALELQRAGVALEVVFPAEGVAPTRYRSAGLPVHIVPAPSKLLEFGGSLLRQRTWKQVWTLARHAVPHSYRVHRRMVVTGSHVLHCNTSRAVVMAALVPRCRGARVLWHMRAQSAASGAHVTRFCQAVSTVIVPISMATCAELTPRSRRKATVVYDGIDGGRCRARATAPGQLADHCERQLGAVGAVVMVASLTPFKGHHWLVAAAALVAESMGESAPCFFLVGSASDASSVEVRYERHLRRLVRDIGLRHVHFLGWVEEPLPLVARATMLVLPSVERDSILLDGRPLAIRGGESFPAATLEAMALGRPVVVTDNAGLVEQVVDGESGFIVPQRDATRLALAIEQLIRDPLLARRVGCAGRARVLAHFDRASTVAALRRLYAAPPG